LTGVSRPVVTRLQRRARTGPAVTGSLRNIWVRLLLYPGHTLPTAAAPVLVGVGLAVHDRVFALWPVLAGFLGSWFIHVGGVFADNHELLRRYPRVDEHPELRQALRSGTLELRHLKSATIACFLLGVAPAPWLVYRGGPLILLIGVVGVAASLLYAAGGLRYVRFGLADPVFFLMFGVVAEVGTYYIQAAPAAGNVWTRWVVPEALPLSVFLAGLPVGALVTNVLVIDDIRDRAFDRVKGWRTRAVRSGIRGSRLQYLSLTAFAYLAPFAGWLWLGYSPWVLLPLLSLPLAVPIARAVMTRHTTEALFPMTPRASMLSLLYAGLLAVGLAL